MAISHKYRSFQELLEVVTVDFATYALEGMIEPQQLIKVAQRVNYDLGFRIHRDLETIIEVENNIGIFPADFATLNYAFVCSDYNIVTELPSGTQIDTTQPVYTPDPSSSSDPCVDNTVCDDVCIVHTNCETSYTIIQKINTSQYRMYSSYFPLRIAPTSFVAEGCPNLNTKSANRAEIFGNNAGQNATIRTTFTTGNIYIGYQSTLEEGGQLMVLDHPYCNEYYEYALKQRILENMIFAGEPVQNQLSLIEQRLRAARNNALTFVNTPDFEELRKVWETNRKAQHDNYYNMFKSAPTLG